MGKQILNEFTCTKCKTIVICTPSQRRKSEGLCTECRNTEKANRNELLNYTSGSCKSLAEIQETFKDEFTPEEVTKILEEDYNMRVCSVCGWWADDGDWGDLESEVTCTECAEEAQESDD